MTIKSPYTRRDIPKMQPDIVGRYHDLLMTNNVPGYGKLLDEYQPHISAEEREELLADFKLGAELLLRRRWRRPK
jgi:hypothetical protein